MSTTLYIASVLATRFIVRIDSEDQLDQGSSHQHMPFPIFAESMENAARQAAAFAFAKWPADDGWKSHNAMIITCPLSLVQHIVPYIQDGRDLTEEQFTKVIVDIEAMESQTFSLADFLDE